MGAMEPGQLVGGTYRLEARVGVGGMGVVFRARDEGSGEVVAIKVLDGAIDAARARREALALRSLSHPGIVRYVADGEAADGRIFLVMEWLDAITLAERIAGAGCTLAEAVAVARQVAAALAVAHRAGIIHRDVKPSNILLVGGEIDGVKLIDFGVARVAAATALTRTGVTMGTPGYMAPEQARGERQLTVAADLFALGCVLHECATGGPAFSGSAVAALMTKILFAEPAPLARHCPEAPAALCRVLERMLCKDPGRRLADAVALIADLDALGALPAGPRRHSRHLVDAPTERSGRAAAHCLVVAGRGQPDDVLAPPTPPQEEALRAAVARWGGRCEVLLTGVVVAHFAGDAADIEPRAAGCAAELRRIAPELVTVVSEAEPELGTVADQATARLSHAALAAIFARR
jgi:eukaryotic-like serine/threonine-protein kinase